MFLLRQRQATEYRDRSDGEDTGDSNRDELPGLEPCYRARDPLIVLLLTRQGDYFRTRSTPALIVPVVRLMPIGSKALLKTHRSESPSRR